MGSETTVHAELALNVEVKHWSFSVSEKLHWNE